VEKFLKALVQESGTPVPRTHDLEELDDLLTPIHPRLRLSRRRLGHMTQYAVEYRYPGMHATAANARAALRFADQARTVVRKTLGLRTTTKRS
jgi:HEPN domain-containing protein